MFWKSKETKDTKEGEVKAEKLPEPKEVPEMVGRYLVTQLKKEPDWVWSLRAVVRQNDKGKNAFDVRVFNEGETGANNVTVKNYHTLDEHPELIFFEGWFDKDSMKVELQEKRAVQECQIFTQDEIRQKIEALSQPGSNVFFYVAGSPCSGGPLGRGADIVELNPNPDKGKKYIIYADDVIGNEPAGKKVKLFDSNEPKKIASYIKEAHHKPQYYR